MIVFRIYLGLWGYPLRKDPHCNAAPEYAAMIFDALNLSYSSIKPYIFETS